MGRFTILWMVLFAGAMWLSAIIFLSVKTRNSRGDDRHRHARMAVVWEMVSLVVVICCFLPLLWAPASVDVPVFLIILVLICVFLLAMSAFRYRELRSEKYYRRLHEREAGFCGRCGYDLTGNVSGVCPECGWNLPDRREVGSAEK